MDLADLLAEESVLSFAEIANKTDLLNRMAVHFAKHHHLDAAIVSQTIADREALGSTGLGNGIAVPHGKVAGLTRVGAVFARLETPIEFDAVDYLPVDLVMMLVAPLGAGADHLKALACVARFLRTERTVEALRATNDPRRLYRILTAPAVTTKAA